MRFGKEQHDNGRRGGEDDLCRSVMVGPEKAEAVAGPSSCIPNEAKTVARRSIAALLATGVADDARVASRGLQSD
jgi:hypothetical protein